VAGNVGGNHCNSVGFHCYSCDYEEYYLVNVTPCNTAGDRRRFVETYFMVEE
jgi:hypothetical protein